DELAHTSKPCPSCFVPISREYGCNTMQCSRCLFRFCWSCLGPAHTHSACVNTINFQSLMKSVSKINDSERKDAALERVIGLTQYIDRSDCKSGFREQCPEEYITYHIDRLRGVWLIPLVDAHCRLEDAMLRGDDCHQTSPVVMHLVDLLLQISKKERRWEDRSQALIRRVHRLYGEVYIVRPGTVNYSRLAASVELDWVLLQKEARRLVELERHRFLRLSMEAWLQHLLGA
ncbi:unnamed protein product, partial [Choristocarpus tenellus]